MHALLSTIFLNWLKEGKNIGCLLEKTSSFHHTECLQTYRDYSKSQGTTIM